MPGPEVLLELITSVLEDALDVAIAAVPDERKAQASETRRLRRAGLYIIALADAYDVLLRRGGEG